MNLQSLCNFAKMMYYSKYKLLMVFKTVFLLMKRFICRLLVCSYSENIYPKFVHKIAKKKLMLLYIKVAIFSLILPLKD